MVLLPSVELRIKFSSEFHPDPCPRYLSIPTPLRGSCSHEEENTKEKFRGRHNFEGITDRTRGFSSVVLEMEGFSLEILKDHAHLSPFIKETIFIDVLRVAINVRVNVVDIDDSIANNILLSKTNVNGVDFKISKNIRLILVLSIVIQRNDININILPYFRSQWKEPKVKVEFLASKETLPDLFTLRFRALHSNISRASSSIILLLLLLLSDKKVSPYDFNPSFSPRRRLWKSHRWRYDGIPMFR